VKMFLGIFVSWLCQAREVKGSAVRAERSKGSAILYGGVGFVM
jgi:hypothetical protein